MKELFWNRFAAKAMAVVPTLALAIVLQGCTHGKPGKV
jgi:hypothetical protein